MHVVAGRDFLATRRRKLKNARVSFLRRFVEVAVGAYMTFSGYQSFAHFSGPAESYNSRSFGRSMLHRRIDALCRTVPGTCVLCAAVCSLFAFVRKRYSASASNASAPSDAADASKHEACRRPRDVHVGIPGRGLSVRLLLNVVFTTYPV